MWHRSVCINCLDQCWAPGWGLGEVQAAHSLLGGLGPPALITFLSTSEFRRLSLWHVFPDHVRQSTKTGPPPVCSHSGLSNSLAHWAVRAFPCLSSPCTVFPGSENEAVPAIISLGQHTAGPGWALCLGLWLCSYSEILPYQTS